MINTGFTGKGNGAAPEGWQVSPGPDGSSTKMSVEEVEGIRALRISDQNPKVGVGLLQTIAVEGGKSYRAGVRIKGGRLALYLNWLDESKKIIPPEHNKSFEGRPGSFESFSLTESAPANARFAQFWIYSPSSAQTEVWAAEPILTEAIPVKESLKIPVPERALVEKFLRREHPRLLLTTSDLERIKGLVRENALMKKSFDIMKARADGMLTQEPCRYEIPDGLRLLATSRLVLDRTYVLGLSFLITGEKKYRDRLWTELESAGKFQDWNPKHTLDTAEMLHAFGIGHDWLYKDWTEEQRKFLVEAVAAKGLQPMSDAYRGKGPTVWWVGGDNNWNFVCNGGGSVAALSIYEDRPELACDVLTNAFRSFQHVMAEFEPDGAWYEGPGYWHFSIKYLVPWFRSFETALGTNFGVLKAFPAFSKTPDFPIHLTGPSGYSYNFADAGTGKTGSMTEIFWFASRMKNPLWHAFEKERLSGVPEELLYFDPVLEGQSLVEAPKDIYFRKTEVATLRSDWSSNALWLGLKAGANGVNHSHDDLGSFVLDANGTRFFEDLGMEQKTYVSYQHHIPHDDFYRIRPEGHNTLVINPGRESGQYGKARVQIAPFVSEANAASASVDLKPAYEDVKHLR
ncbi:MAG: heparinase II/III family protein, partial [Spirochaetia bacterium]|nr:heparinase II/III family protein [Spirochaetia bacterium]